jgi:hypothetical protein
MCSKKRRQSLRVCLLNALGFFFFFFCVLNSNRSEICDIK